MADVVLKPGLESSKGRTGPWGGSRLINGFAEQSNGDKSVLYAVMAIPGLTLFSNINSLPVRGTHRVGSVLYAVVGTGLYTIASDGTATFLATIPGTNPVRMADNGTQLAIHDGDQTGYVWNNGSLTTPLNLPSTADVTFIDGYFVWVLYSSNQFAISALGDATSYDPLDVATVEGAPGNLVGVINDHRELIFFKGSDGHPSAEIWYDSGAQDFPFERQGNAFIERGCIDKNSIVKFDNSTIFVGDDRIVYRLSWYQPERISTHAVERILDNAAWFRAFTYSEEGHKFYVLNTDQGTVAYDVATDSWAERQSFNLDYYRIGYAVEAYGQTYFGSNQTGKLYVGDLDTNSEDGDPLPVTIQLPPVGDGVNRRTLYSFEVFMQTGVGDLTTTEPQVILTYSKDGGQTWSNEMWRPMGAQGEYRTRAVWRNLGEFRQIQLKLTFPDKVKRLVLAYHADYR